MTTSDIPAMRLSGQGLVGSDFTTPEDVIRHLGAVQAQDFPAALWALDQRLNIRQTENALERDFNEGKFVRTHVMRPTWHFVHPTDARWMLELTSGQVKRAMGSYNKKLELTDQVFAASQTAFRRVLAGRNFLTRQELKKVLEEIGIPTDVQRLAHLLMQAELDCVITSGPRINKHFSYALFDERIPDGKKLSREEALSELTKRYFQSHGPATLRDFAWWSGLMAADAKQGVGFNQLLQKEVVGGVEYWFFPSKEKGKTTKAFLLPNYDEYGIAYKERSTFFHPEYVQLLGSRGNAAFQHLIMMDGYIIGTWKRTLKKNTVLVECTFFSAPSRKEREALDQAVELYGKFLNKSALLSV